MSEGKTQIPVVQFLAANKAYAVSQRLAGVVAARLDAEPAFAAWLQEQADMLRDVHDDLYGRPQAEAKLHVINNSSAET